MNKQGFTLFTGLFLLMLFFQLNAQENEWLRADDSRVVIMGSNFIKMERGEMIIHRHSDAAYAGTTKSNLFNPTKARSASGILLKFKTDSPKVVAKFRIIKGSNKSPIFSIFQNDDFVKNQRFQYREDSIIMLKLHSLNVGDTILYTLAFPLRTDVHFLGLSLDKGFDLVDIEEEKKAVYLAFGDSVTHGTGQKTTPETYAYLLAQKMNWELFNLAVGGGKTSQFMAEMIRDDFERVDFITILVGFNDYNGEGVDTATYSIRYTNMINTIREKHPNTKLYCISMTYTEASHSKTSQIPVEDFRAVVGNIVADMKKLGDENIFLIKGEEISTAENLKDKVHFSVDGARDFADALYDEIIKI